MVTHDHGHDHGLWTHDHHFLGHGHDEAERRAKLAVGVTVLFMALEICAGLYFGSMALLADGVHMATHVGALGLAAAAYWLARRYARDSRFTFGSGKFGDLASFASAIGLGMIGLGVAIESVQRLLSPVAIDYRAALPIAVLGLLVNAISAVVLHGGGSHFSHDHVGHAHAHAHAHDHDHNLRAAYTHVLADAATSALAIAALGLGWLFHLRWLDPLVGLIGAGVIASWAVTLIRDSGLVLLDAEADPHRAASIRAMIETELGARVADLHLWRLGPGHHGLIVSLVSPDQATSQRIRAELRSRYSDLSHVTVEVAVCADCAAP